MVVRQGCVGAGGTGGAVRAAGARLVGGVGRACERLRGLSVGVEGGSEVGGDEVGPVFLGASGARLGLEVALDEGVKQVVGNKQQ